MMVVVELYHTSYSSRGMNKTQVTQRRVWLTWVVRSREPQRICEPNIRKRATICWKSQLSLRNKREIPCDKRLHWRFTSHKAMGSWCLRTQPATQMFTGKWIHSAETCDLKTGCWCDVGADNTIRRCNLIRTLMYVNVALVPWHSSRKSIVYKRSYPSELEQCLRETPRIWKIQRLVEQKGLLLNDNQKDTFKFWDTTIGEAEFPGSKVLHLWFYMSRTSIGHLQALSSFGCALRKAPSSCVIQRWVTDRIPAPIQEEWCYREETLWESSVEEAVSEIRRRDKLPHGVLKKNTKLPSNE